MSTIVQISDLHFGAEDPRLVAALERAISDIAPDLIAVSGDLTQKGKRREFNAAAEFLSGLEPPVMIAAGNHDIPLLQILTRVAAPFARFHKRVAHARVEAFDESSLIARTLNTARGVQARRDWSLGSVNLQDVRDIVHDFEAAPPEAARVIVCHHPLLTPKDAPLRARTRRGYAAARLMAQRGVDLLLTGHMHVEFSERLPFHDMGTWTVGAGTALSTRTRGAPASFNAIEARPDCFVMTVYRDRGKAFEPEDERRLERRARAG